MGSELLQMSIDGHQGCCDFSRFGFAHDGHQCGRHRKFDAGLPARPDHMGVWWRVIVGVHHKPQALGKEAKRYQVEEVRELLERAGVQQ